MHTNASVQFLPRYVQQAIEKEEHGFAMIIVVENGSPEQDMWNQQMISLAREHRERKGLRSRIISSVAHKEEHAGRPSDIDMSLPESPIRFYIWRSVPTVQRVDT